jgi:transposase
VALLGIIRRWYIRDRVSIREIARRLDISRNTVRRYIRSEAIEPSYPTRQSPSSLDEFAPRLSAWLSAEAVKSRKQRRTLKQMFLDLKELGYEGSYDRVAAFGRQWKVGQMARVNSASKSTPLLSGVIVWITGCSKAFNPLVAGSSPARPTRNTKGSSSLSPFVFRACENVTAIQTRHPSGFPRCKPDHPRTRRHDTLVSSNW